MRRTRLRPDKCNRPTRAAPGPPVRRAVRRCASCLASCCWSRPLRPQQQLPPLQLPRGDNVPRRWPRPWCFAAGSCPHLHHAVAAVGGCRLGEALGWASRVLHRTFGCEIQNDIIITKNINKKTCIQLSSFLNEQ